ncbi:MAG TPA: VOC family protein [Bacteroidota bacterium]|nr:VOC family protein [Bacteroidota bacterium]
MQKITTFLWFNNQAEDAAKFYCSIFRQSRIISSTPMIVTFELEGQKFIALNGGPQFKFNEAISLFVDCDSQKEVTYYWEKLTVGGEESRCGWLKDKFGLSWQIVPALLMKLLGDPDHAKSHRVMQAMLKMNKIDSELLQKAYDANA